MKHFCCLLVVAMGLFCDAALGQFTKPALYAVGEEPQMVVAADFNNDGKLDLATANFTSANFSVLLGNGNGKFQAAQEFSTTYGPTALAVGDFNGDGNLDIAVVEYVLNQSVLQIFLGKGDGTFTAGASYSTVSYPYSITVADFNGDGRLDLAVANDGNNTVTLFLGKEDGTFRKSRSYHVPEPERVLAVDLNGDGHPDLAVLAYCGKKVKTCVSGAVAVLLNEGGGTFQKPVYYSVNGVGPDGIAADDLSNNGKIDLVVANNNFQSASTLSVLLGNGDGTFQAAVNYPVGDGPAGIAIADFNGDGNLDLAVANTASFTVSLLYGNGNGTFQTAQNIQFAGDSLPISVAGANFNGDGTPDMAVALCYANEVAVLLSIK